MYSLLSSLNVQMNPHGILFLPKVLFLPQDTDIAALHNDNMYLILEYILTFAGSCMVAVVIRARVLREICTSFFWYVDVRWYITNAASNEWKVVDMKGQAPSPRFNHSCVLHNGQLFVFGGSKDQSCSL